MKNRNKHFILSALFALCTSASFAQDPFVVEYEQSPPPQSIIAILIGLFSADDFDFNGDGKRDIIARVGNNLVVRTFSQPDNMVFNATTYNISLNEIYCLGFHDVGGSAEKEMILVPKLGYTGDVIACKLNPNNQFVPSFSWGASETGTWVFGVENTDGDAQSEILAVNTGEQFYVLGQGFTPGFTGDDTTNKFKGDNPSEKVMGLNFQLQYVAPPNFRWPENRIYLEPGYRDFDGDGINDYGSIRFDGIDGECQVISGATQEEVYNSGEVISESFALNYLTIGFFQVTEEDGPKHVMVGFSNTSNKLTDMEIILWLNPVTNEVNTSLLPFLEAGFRVVGIGNPFGFGGTVTAGIIMRHMNTGRVIVVGDGPGFQGGSDPTLWEPNVPDENRLLPYELNLVFESQVPLTFFMPPQGDFGGTELDVNGDGTPDLPFLVLQDSSSNIPVGYTVLDGTTNEPIWQTSIPTGVQIDPAPYFHGFFDANGDGQKEIIYGAETVQTSDSEIHKPFGTGFQIRYIYDIDGDGFEEIIGSTPEGKVQVWSSHTFVSSIFEEQVQDMLRLSLFPNPTSEVLILNWEQTAAGEANLDIIDARGVVVQQAVLGQFAPGAASSSVRLSEHLPNGLYFCKVLAGTGVQVSSVLLAR
jgi:Secretion system C-terminal sorting domain